MIKIRSKLLLLFLVALCIIFFSKFELDKQPEVKNYLNMTLKDKPVEPKPFYNTSYTLIIDGLIFELQQGRKKGISNVWSNLMPHLNNYFKGHLYFINRTPQYLQNQEITKLNNVKSIFPMGRSLDNMVNDIIQESKTNVTFFISTYYNYPNDLKKVCSVIMYHDLIPENVGLYHGPNSEYYPRIGILDVIDSVISISQSTTNDLIRFYGQKLIHPKYNSSDPNSNYPQHIISTIPNRVNTDIFKGKSSQLEIDSFKEKFGIPKDKRYFLTVGTSYDYKNTDVMFAAFSQIGKELLHNVVLVMIGRSVITEKERNAAKPCNIVLNGNKVEPSCGISAYIVNTQDDNDLAAAYSGALALIYISAYEGFGLPLVEAMQQETLAIVTYSSSLPEVGGPDAPLYVGKVPTPLDVKNAITKVIYMFPNERERRIQAGLKHIEKFGGGQNGKKHGWNEMADSIIKHLLSNAHRGEHCYRN